MTTDISMEQLKADAVDISQGICLFGICDLRHPKEF